MIVLRVIQFSVLGLTLFFLVMTFIHLFSDEKNNGVGLYASLFAAGAMMSVLIRIGVRALKKHL